MRYKTILLLVLSAWGIMACQNYTDKIAVEIRQPVYPVLTLKEHNPVLCLRLTADNMVVGRNDTLLYLYNYETQQELTYDIGNGKLNAVPMDDSFLPLKEYSFSMLQSAEFLVKHGKTLNSIPFTQQ